MSIPAAQPAPLLEEITKARESLETTNVQSERAHEKLRDELNSAFAETDAVAEEFVAELEHSPKLDTSNTGE